MKDAAKQFDTFNDATNNGIAADDPLFELSRIIGFGDKAAQPAAQNLQIDLEEALMAEMAKEPVQDPSYCAVEEAKSHEENILNDLPIDSSVYASETYLNSAPKSLEDELAAMLGADVTGTAQVPETVEVFQPPVEQMAEHFAEQSDGLAEQIAPLSGTETSILNDGVSYASDIDPNRESDIELSFANDTRVSDDLDIDVELEDEFAAFFDEELPVLEPILQPNRDSEVEVVAVSEVCARTYDPLADLPPENHEHSKIVASVVTDRSGVFGQVADLPYPTIETTDMSGFDMEVISHIEVPDLPDIDSEIADIFSEELSALPNDDGNDILNNATASVVGAAAVAGMSGVAANNLSKRTGQAAMHDDDLAFDESRFEAELARDMEFVSHDLDASRAPENIALEDGFENQDFAVAAAENRPARRGLVIAAVLGCVAIAGAIGVFAFSSSNSTVDNGPVLVEAGTEPMKVAPENPGGKQVPNQDRAVFNQTADAPAQAELNSTSEEPVDISAVAEKALPNIIGDLGDQKGEDRLVPIETNSANSAETADGLIAPRRVRTLVVRPDGSLVESAEVPTPQPIEPAVAQTPPAAKTAIVEAAPVAAEKPLVAKAPPVEVAAVQSKVADSAPNAQEAVIVPTRKVRTQPIVAPAAIAQRPADQPVTIVNPRPTRTAAAAPAQATPSSFVVQLASLPTAADAKRSATNLSAKLGSVLGGRGVSIRSAVLSGRGTFYRVSVAADSRADATALCGRIKSAGADCFVTR